MALGFCDGFWFLMMAFGFRDGLVFRDGFGFVVTVVFWFSVTAFLFLVMFFG